MSAPKKINLGMINASSLIEDAKQSMDDWGKTDLYSTGDPIIDEYLGNSSKGGYGRNGYEVITIFGNTGCISGDSILRFKSKYVKRTKKISAKNLYNRFHHTPYRGCHGPHLDEVIRLRTTSGENLPAWTTVVDVIDKGVLPVWRIFAGGKSLVATPDHPILTPSGWKCMADIKVGDKVIMAGTSSKSRGGKKIVRDHLVYTKFHPINRTVNVEGKYCYHVGFEHRLRYEAMMNGMGYGEYINLLNNYDGRPLEVIPAGMEIHHKDGDHTNNDVNNLELLSKRDHALLGVEQSLMNLDYSDVETEVESVVPCGEEHVYDVCCEGEHSFVANDFYVHNCNKSTFCTSMILSPAKGGTQVAYFALEDDPKDVVRRVLVMCDMNEEEARSITKNILFMPESDGYTLDAMADAIEKIFKIADIVVVDPLQFVFEASVAEKGETEFNRQRLFMRKMNNVMKHTNKTLILVSHTNKSGNDKTAKLGLDRIIGSSAIAQVSTKVIEIGRREDGTQGIRLWKTRFTPYRHVGLQTRLDNMKIRSVCDASDLPQLRQAWNGVKI